MKCNDKEIQVIGDPPSGLIEDQLMLAYYGKQPDRVFGYYQDQAATTAQYPAQGQVSGLQYVALGLVNEAGEFAGKVKKMMRGDRGYEYGSASFKKLAEDELGDVLWYLSQCCIELGLDLEGVACANLGKLADRKRRDVIKGDGDYR